MSHEPTFTRRAALDFLSECETHLPTSERKNYRAALDVLTYGESPAPAEPYCLTHPFGGCQCHVASLTPKEER